MHLIRISFNKIKLNKITLLITFINFVINFVDGYIFELLMKC